LSEIVVFTTAFGILIFRIYGNCIKIIGGTTLFELFLFIDPLCKSCRNSEDTVLKLSKDIKSNIKLQFIPIYNLKVVQTDFCNSNNQLKKTLSQAELAILYNNVILDYKAALFQGMRKGRNYLINIQDKLLLQNKEYSNDLAIQIARKCHLDIDMFKEDRRSDLARKAIKKDQEIVQNMKITIPSSAVIFNCDNLSQDGILTTDVKYSTLFKVCCDNGFTSNKMKNAISNSYKNHLRILK
jgi:hypothetical protein